MSKTGFVIQARTGSSRLPKKILKKILNLNSIEIIIRRLKKKFNDKYPIIIATTKDKDDDVLVKIAEKYNINYFRGSEKNVLSRYYFASKKYNLDWVVRITSDCPLINTGLLYRMLKIKKKNLDIISNVIVRTYPKGLDLEIVKFNLLKKLYNLKLSKKYLEHVTNYIYKNIKNYKFYSYESKKNLSHIRITLDTANDLKKIKKIFNQKKSIYFNYQ